MNDHRSSARGGALARVALRGSIVLLAVATAAIHLSLGGLMFLLNAAGYATLAAGMVAPGPFRRARPLIRLALLGFTGVTIAAWLLFGVRFPLAYADKAIEVVLVGLLLVEMWLRDGGPLGLARWGRRCLTELIDGAGRRIASGGAR